MNEEKKKLIIDGHNYLFRAYYGIPKAVLLPDGQVGNAVYGFFAFLRRMVQWTNPERVIVVFDSQTGILEKQDQMLDYKSNREAPEENMWTQLKIIKSMLDSLNILAIEEPNLEADDIIGTIASTEKLGHLSFISSGDNDFIQLVSPTTKIVREVAGKLSVIDEGAVLSKLKIRPNQYVDYIALKGDPADNISGIKGIGQKTAQLLLEKYGDIPSLLFNLENLSPRHQEILKDEKDRLLELRQFLEINRGVKLSFRIDETKGFREDLLSQKTNEIFKENVW